MNHKIISHPSAMNRLLLIISLIIYLGIDAQEEVDFYYNEYEITSKAEFEL